MTAKHAVRTLLGVTVALALLAGCAGGEEFNGGEPTDEPAGADEPEGDDQDSRSAADGSELDGLSHDELVERAREEGEVTVFSFTSRIASVAEAWEEAYPDIQINAHDISSTEQIARLQAEQQAGVVETDVAYISDAPVVFGDLVADGVLQRYVPPEFEDLVPAEHTEPLLSNRLSTKVLMYNADAHPDGSPVDSLWELTEEEWRGNVIMVDPLLRGDFLDFMIEVVLHADEMEANYEAHFGEAIEIDSDLDNAGEQWIVDLLANDVIMVDSNNAVAEGIGPVGQDNPPIGISTYSNIRDNEEEGWALELANDVEPSPGVLYPALLGMVNDAPNPAAARLLIHFMMGDDSSDGGPAYQPFYVPGDYPTRSDMSHHPDALPLDEFRAWRQDPVANFEIRDHVADLILASQ